MMYQILIIEDNEINCMIYEKILSNDDTTIDFAYDGQEGIDKFKEKFYHLIVLDLGLPKIGGLKVAQLIKEHEAREKRVTKAPIIVITADRSPETRQLALATGIDEFLTNPFNIDQLQKMVRQYIKQQIRRIKSTHRDIVKRLSNSTNYLVCVHDLNGIYKYVSPSISDLTDYDAKDILGKTPYDFFHPDDNGMMEEHYWKILASANDTSKSCTYRFRLKNGDYTWFETDTKLIWDELGTLTGIITYTKTINERKQAEEQTLQALQQERYLNQLKSNFVNLVSHEFRTPLACIRSSAELLDIETSKSDADVVKKHRHIQNIFNEVDKLSELIDKTLTVGKIESQAFTAKKEKILLSEILKLNIKKLEDLQDDQRKVHLTINNEDRPVMADPLLIGHVFTNLISNAFKFSKGKRPPHISVDYCTNNYVVKIKDFGLGIPFDDQPKIFQSFFRAENAYGINGTGLGMLITKKFIEMHGGTLSFTSIPEKGTEFTLILPDNSNHQYTNIGRQRNNITNDVA